MKLYLTGPMTGIDDFNYPEFHRVKGILETAGYEVESPADHPLNPEWDWVDYMLVDIDQIFACDGVATLDGCEKSKGSRIECRIAENLALPIQTYEAWLNDA